MSNFCPDTRGQWWTLFLGSLVQLHCGEGGTLQTNNTGVCSQCLSHTGPAPAHGTHSSGSRLPHWEPSKAGPELHAPPRSKLLRLRHSGSPQRRRLGWACVLWPSYVQHLGCLASAVTVAYRPSRPCCSAFWVYRWRPFSGGWCLSRAPRRLS